MINMTCNLYQDLTEVISTDAWQTDPFHLQIGVYQGDPLSVLVFSTVMNTLVDTITKSHADMGYSLGTSSHNLLQYADNTSLIADGPSSCQTLLSTTEAWLVRSGMKANIPKCVSLAVGLPAASRMTPSLPSMEKSSLTLGTASSTSSGPQCAPMALRRKHERGYQGS